MTPASRGKPGKAYPRTPLLSLPLGLIIGWIQQKTRGQRSTYKPREVHLSEKERGCKRGDIDHLKEQYSKYLHTCPARKWAAKLKNLREQSIPQNTLQVRSLKTAAKCSSEKQAKMLPLESQEKNGMHSQSLLIWTWECLSVLPNESLHCAYYIVGER